MKELRVTKFKADDAMAMTKNKEGITEKKINQWVDTIASAGPAYTLRCLDKPVLCGGVQILWEGVGEAWVLMIDEIEKYTVAHRMVKDILEYIISTFHLHRVQAYARADKPEFARYLEYMGFKKEAKCRKFESDGTDAYLYARVM